MKFPWNAMTDEQLVARCRQGTGAAAWEKFGERYGCHLLAGAFVAWFAYATWPVPWYGYFGLVPIYFIAAGLAYLFVVLIPACARTIPYSAELNRRHSLFDFPSQVRKARRLFDGSDPPDWIILVHWEEVWGHWTWTCLTLFESPLRGLREHRSGSGFGAIRDPLENPLKHLVREDRLLEEDECRATLERLRQIDLNEVVDVQVQAFDVEYYRLALLRRDPPLTRKIKFSPSPVIVYLNPEARQLATYRLASLIIKLPKELTV